MGQAAWRLATRSRGLATISAAIHNGCAWLWRGIPLLLLACDSGYPIAPTFCDDWCRATQAEQCGQPVGCVRDCEDRRQVPRCEATERRLLHCYQETTKADYLCVGREVRVATDACRNERDALQECVFPGISACLSVCRAEQQAQLDIVVDPITLATDYAALRREGETACPALDQPCEAICHDLSLVLEGVQGAPSFPDNVVGDAAPPDAAATPGDADGSAGAQAPLSCFADVFVRCFVTHEPGSGKVETLQEALSACFLP